MRTPPAPHSPSLSLAALCVLLASCGGGGGGTTDTSAAATSTASTGAVSTSSSSTTTSTAVSAASTVSTGATTTVNAALVPAAKPGAPDRRINNTGEMPYVDPDGMGAFRTVCQYSHMNFDDPLVYPGQPGRAHLHVFFGNTGTTGNSTPESIRTSGNSTCRGGIVNRSSYWVPAMIDTRTGQPIQPRDDIDVYYKTGYGLFGQNGAVRAFPVNFRMIASDAKSRVAQPHAYYECHTTGVESGSIPNCAGGELWQVVEFPQCWNGVDLDSPDHRSHVVYASNGSCPSGFPVHLPQVTYHVKYDVPASGASTWRLASDIDGAPAGSSGHGDWVNGWDQEVMDTFVARVIQLGLSGGSHMVGDGRVIFYY